MKNIHKHEEKKTKKLEKVLDLINRIYTNKEK